jgi:malic enzyme
MQEHLKDQSLNYHEEFPAGKIGTEITKPLKGKLNLAYSPGVAYPCLEIQKDKETAYKYTNKGNMIAIISDGTAVLGLGDIGALSSKPVMEGKSALFKALGGVDCVDIEINEKDPDKLVDIISAISTGFGGINLEDISAPRCFEIEERLRERLDVPVFHDDQHGFAIVSCAALINTLDVTKKDIKDIKIVVLGAGAASIAALNLIIKLGANKSNIKLFDSKGIISDNRKDLNKYKAAYSSAKEMSLEQALVDADVFIGASVANALKPDWIKRMAKDPLIIAAANPVPEIMPNDAEAIRPDCIICTGRSDFKNQVNNILCFPYLFRVALDFGLKITHEMKIAAVYAIAEYTRRNPSYGKNYILPDPMDEALRYLMPSYIAKAIGVIKEEEVPHYLRKVVGPRFMRQFRDEIFDFDTSENVKPQNPVLEKLKSIIKRLFSSDNHPKSTDMIGFDESCKAKACNAVMNAMGYRVTKEKNAKMMEMDFSKSFFANLSSHIAILYINGTFYCVEENCDTYLDCLVGIIDVKIEVDGSEPKFYFNPSFDIEHIIYFNVLCNYVQYAY